METIKVCIYLVVFYTSSNVSAFESICTSEEPNENQICFSLAIPMKGKGVSVRKHYICVDKEKVDYVEKDRCPSGLGENEKKHFCQPSLDHSFVLEAPWLCCPQVSEPNRCKEVTCELYPFNRTCKALKEKDACCSFFYCGLSQDESEFHSGCENIRCESHRHTDSENTSCRLFMDPHDCCPKYECPGQEQAENNSLSCPSSLFLGTSWEHIRKWGLIDSAFDAQKLKEERESFRLSQGQKELVSGIRFCVGDHTCPRGHKCCPGSLQGGLDNFPPPKDGATYGFCLHEDLLDIHL